MNDATFWSLSILAILGLYALVVYLYHRRNVAADRMGDALTPEALGETGVLDTRPGHGETETQAERMP